MRLQENSGTVVFIGTRAHAHTFPENELLGDLSKAAEASFSINVAELLAGEEKRKRRTETFSCLADLKIRGRKLECKHHFLPLHMFRRPRRINASVLSENNTVSCGGAKY